MGRIGASVVDVAGEVVGGLGVAGSDGAGGGATVVGGVNPLVGVTMWTTPWPSTAGRGWYAPRSSPTSTGGPKVRPPSGEEANMALSGFPVPPACCQARYTCDGLFGSMATKGRRLASRPSAGVASCGGW